MMKLLILSDIHSNVYALEAIWARESDCDAIYCVGDLVDYGPFPKETIRWCREHHVRSVIGNHDQRLIQIYNQLNGDVSGIAPEDYCWVHDNCSLLDWEDVAYLESLPEILDFTADGYYYRLSHQFAPKYGRPQGIHQFDEFVYRNPPERTDLPFRLIFGHSHRQAICQFRGEKLWMNPGSASYRRPDDQEKSAHYAVIENGLIDLRAVEYDRTPLLQRTVDLALSGKLQEAEQRVAFFFFGSAPSTDTPAKDSLQQSLAQLKMGGQ